MVVVVVVVVHLLHCLISCSVSSIYCYFKKFVFFMRITLSWMNQQEENHRYCCGPAISIKSVIELFVSCCSVTLYCCIQTPC